MNAGFYIIMAAQFFSSLADNGTVTAETLVYDATTEQWVALSTQASTLITEH